MPGDRRIAGVKAAALLVIAAGLAAAPITAQLHFVDELIRVTVLEGPEVEVVFIAPFSRPVEVVADAVRALCVVPGFDQLATASAINAIGWQFQSRPSKLPFSGPEFEAAVPQWVAPDAILVSTAARVGGSGDRLHVAGPQCNLIMIPTSAVNAETLRPTFTAAFGEPSNAADAVGKNGKPNKNYTPEWTVQRANEQAVQVMLFRSTPGGRGQAGRLQIAVVPKPAEKSTR